MSRCPHCRHDNSADAAFCDECGARLDAACPSCGETNRPGAKFCRKCGHGLGRGSETGPPAPESYTPRHLAEKILTTKASLEGERKQVTVLFADLKGSMELVADRDPEEARKLLDPVLEHMMEAVHRYEGTVNQVMGDGIMALFGAPLAHEDHAVRACYAALRMQETVRKYADAIRRTEGIPIQIRIGVNSGEVVVRSIGNDLRMDYTAVGQTTHLAARMEQMAVPGSILISPDTLAFAEGYVIVTGLGAIPVKGLEAPIEVYEVTGAATARSRLQAAAARGLTRFVGRDTEVEQLRQALDRAKSGNGQVAAVVGEPGVGKSRLFWEFTQSHRTAGCLIVESSSVSYGKATGFLPVIDLLRSYFQIEPRDDARKVREKVTGKLLSLDRILESSLHAFLWLLDVPVDDPQWEKLEPAQRRQRTLDGVKRLLLRESQVQPVLVIFEDLHWIDAETQALLDSLVESLPAARVLLLVNYRPEYQHAWSGKTYYRQLRIDALPPESADELLEGLLGSDPGLLSLKRLLIERTGGNPFFLEESVRTLVETKALTGDRGAYRLARASQSFQIPATAQAILAARIDRLAPEEKRLLQAAAVIGKDVPFGLLQAIAEGSEEELRRGLARLITGEFLYEARLFPDLEYTFKHALINDVAYGSLLNDRRRALHARIVDAIEALHADRVAEHLESLAHHAFRGEVWDKAVSYLRQAGAKAFARSANREAVGWFEQALVALGHLPETRERRELAIDLRFDLRTSLFPLGELDRLVACLGEAQTIAEGLGDQRRLGWVSVYMSHYLWMAGRSPEARTFAHNAQAIAEPLSDFPLKVGANFYVGTVSLTSGDYVQARTFLQTVVELVSGERQRDRLGLAAYPAAMARGYLTWALTELGAFDDAMAYGEEGVRIGEALDHPYSWIVASWGLAYLHRIRGDQRHASRLLERAFALCHDWNLPVLASITAGLLGSNYAGSGRLDEGLALLAEGQKAFESLQTLFVAQFAEAHMLAGRLEEAVAHARRALGLARERGQRGYEAWTHHILGEIAMHHVPLDPAAGLSQYREALALAEALGMRPLTANCHLGLGKLYRQSGQHGQAREHLSTAMAMFKEMGMAHGQAEAEKETMELR